jgi:hypothetical protein
VPICSCGSQPCLPPEFKCMSYMWGFLSGHSSSFQRSLPCDCLLVELLRESWNCVAIRNRSVPELTPPTPFPAYAPLRVLTRLAVGSMHGIRCKCEKQQLNKIEDYYDKCVWSGSCWLVVQQICTSARVKFVASLFLQCIVNCSVCCVVAEAFCCPSCRSCVMSAFTSVILSLGCWRGCEKAGPLLVVDPN